MSNICVIGTGYVGLVTGVCFADLGNHVICLDVDQKRIDGLKNNIMPIYEPGLEQLTIQNVKAGTAQLHHRLPRSPGRHGIRFHCCWYALGCGR